MPDVFLSYNRLDKEAAQTIANLLGQKGVNVFFDQSSILPGKQFPYELTTALRAMHAFSLLVGPHEMGPWQEREMQAALTEATDRGIPIIPVFLPGTPADVTLPLFLQTYHWVDLRSGIDEAGILRIVEGIRGSRNTSPHPAHPTTGLAAILRRAEKRLVISGQTLDRFSSSPEVRKAILEVLSRGVSVTMMMLNPRSSHASAHRPFHTLESAASEADEYRKTLAFLTNLFDAYKDDVGLEVVFTNYMPRFRTIIVDEDVYLYFYMYAADVDDEPNLILKPSNGDDALRKRLIQSTDRQILAPETIPFIRDGQIYPRWDESKLANWDRWTADEQTRHRITHEFYVTHAFEFNERFGYAIEKEVSAHLDSLRGRTLVLGCGSGKEVQYCAEKRPGDEIVGLDFSPVAIKLAKKRHPKLACCFKVGDLYDIPLLFDKKFDSIIANAALVHLLKRDDMRVMLRLIWDNLQPKGRAFIRCLYKERDGRPVLEDLSGSADRWNAQRWFVYYSRRELAKSAEDVDAAKGIGFKVLEHETETIGKKTLELTAKALKTALDKGFAHISYREVYWPSLLLEKPDSSGPDASFR